MHRREVVYNKDGTLCALLANCSGVQIGNGNVAVFAAPAAPSSSSAARRSPSPTPPRPPGSPSAGRAKSVMPLTRNTARFLDAAALTENPERRCGPYGSPQTTMFREDAFALFNFSTQNERREDRLRRWRQRENWEEGRPPRPPLLPSVPGIVITEVKDGGEEEREESGGDDGRRPPRAASPSGDSLASFEILSGPPSSSIDDGERLRVPTASPPASPPPFPPPATRWPGAAPAGGRVCLCHGRPSAFRLCRVIQESFFSCSDADFAHGRLSRLASDITQGRGGSAAELLQRLLDDGPGILRRQPGLFVYFGEVYACTLADARLDPLVAYRDRALVCGRVADFFETHLADLRGLLRSMQTWFRIRLPRGLYAAVVYFEILANNLGGRDESALHVNARVSAALASLLCRRGGDDLSRHYLDALHGDDGPLRVFVRFMHRFCNGELFPAPVVLANAGLAAPLPLCGAYHLCVREPRFRASVLGVVDEAAALLLAGVSVSLNLTALPSSADALDVFENLVSRHRLVRKNGRLAGSLCLYLDLWHLDALAVLKRVLSTGGRDLDDGVTVAVRVPSCFMESRSSGDGDWFMFYEPAEELSGVGPFCFARAYERAATADRGLKVDAAQLYRVLCRAVATGRVAVTFPDLVADRAMADRPHCGWPPLGADVASGGLCPVGSTAVYQFTVDLHQMVSYGGKPRDDAEDHEYFGGDGYYFNFVALRDAVRDAVVALNALMDADLADDVRGLLALTARYRSLAVGAVGFHSALVKLGISYDSHRAEELGALIAENMYYSAARTSADICARGESRFGAFDETPYVRGEVAPDEHDLDDPCRLPAAWWARLRDDIARHGIRNAQLVSLGARDDVADLAGVSAGFSAMSRYVRERPCCFMRREYRGDGGDGDGGEGEGDGRRNGSGGFRKMRRASVVRETVGPENRLGPVTVPVVDMTYVLSSEDEDDGDYDDCGLRLASAVPKKRRRPRGDLTGYRFPPERTLEMCRSRAPFVDQAEAPVLYVRDEDPVARIGRLIELAHGYGLKVAVYRCHVEWLDKGETGKKDDG